ncbi:Ribosomal protein S6 kinase alpha-5, partial [Zootermopsis nevadensis]
MGNERSEDREDGLERRENSKNAGYQWERILSSQLNVDAVRACVWPANGPVRSRRVALQFALYYRQPQTDDITLDDFERLWMIGKGGYGEVHLVKQIRGLNVGKYYAMKIMEMNDITRSTVIIRHTQTECIVSAEVGDSPFLVKSHYTFVTKSHLHLVMGEYMKNCSHVRDRTATGCLGPEWQRTEMGFIYRDLKPENILIDSIGHLRITDYGLCRKLCPPQK